MNKILTLTIIFVVSAVIHLNSSSKPEYVDENEEFIEIVKKETVVDKNQKENITKLRKWFEKGAKEDKKEKEVKKKKVKEEDDVYSVQTKIDDCFEKFDDETYNYWDYGHEFLKCKKIEIIFINCFYIEGIEEKKECIAKSEVEANQLAVESRSEYFRDTPEELEAQRKKKADKKEELKDTMKEAIQESRDY